ncbi:hypothetical protein D3C87_1724920 [compost metagenome]
MNYSAAGGKIFNWSFIDFSANALLTYRDSAGTNLLETPYASPTEVDWGGVQAWPLSERSHKNIYYPFYVPQPNSLMYMGRKGQRYKFYISGVNGPLDASPP